MVEFVLVGYLPILIVWFGLVWCGWVVIGLIWFNFISIIFVDSLRYIQREFGRI